MISGGSLIVLFYAYFLRALYQMQTGRAQQGE
jgi:hypothetical protein